MTPSFLDSADSALALRYGQNQSELNTPGARSAICHERFLPYNALSIEGLECSAMCRQAGWVGGDFYDFLALQNGELGIVLGDVCGKGFTASLMMEELLAKLRVESRQASADLSGLMMTVNRFIYQSSLERLYSTLFMASFNPRTRIVRYVNSGHPPPMIVRRKCLKIEWLNRGGPPIGMFDDCTYSLGTSRLDPGDVMVAYTDGIVESPNVKGEQWGVERLIRTVARNRRTAPECSSAIVETVDAFSRGAKERDDMALVVLRAL